MLSCLKDLPSKLIYESTNKSNNVLSKDTSTEEYCISHDHNYCLPDNVYSINDEHNYCMKSTSLTVKPNDKIEKDTDITLTKHEIDMFSEHSYCMMGTVSIMSINVGGLKQRLRGVELIDEFKNCDIAMIQETKCDETDEDEIKEELLAQGLLIEFKHRLKIAKHRAGGGRNSF